MIQVAESNNLNRGSSQEPGSSRTGEGQLANRLSQAIPVKAELRYLTDFFPDQGSSDRRLTRSQTLYSSPSSSAVVIVFRFLLVEYIFLYHTLFFMSE